MTRLTGRNEQARTAGNVDTSPRELIAIYPDRAAADAASQALIDVGVAPDRVRIGAPRDFRVEVAAEMREEATRSWILLPKEPVKGLILIPLCVLVGAALAMPLGLISYGGVAVGTRVAVAAGVGAAAGLIVGFLVGALLGARPLKEDAAHRDVPVRAPYTPDVENELRARRPIRLDAVRLDDDQPIETLTTD